MDTEKIEVLIRAIELGSLSKAAAEYLYTPSALSHILDGIEEEVGARFIKRTYTGIEVIKGCEEIVDNLKKIVELKKYTKQIAKEINKNNSVLTIATYASLSKHLLAKIIKGFNEKHPNIHINIFVVESMQKVFEQEKADILFGESVRAENVVWEEVLTDPYVAVIPKSYEYQGSEIKREQLYQYTFLKATDKNTSAYIDEGKFRDVINVQSQDDSSVIHLVKEGLGIAVLPKLSVYCDENAHCVKLQPEFSRTLGITYKEKTFAGKTELQKFVKYIRKFDFKQFIY